MEDLILINQENISKDIDWNPKEGFHGSYMLK